MAVMPSPALPEQIHRYRVLSELGRGSMGRVYLALDPNIDRRIALKVLMPERLRGAGEEELRRRFLQEAKAAGGLSHHGIVTIHDADTDPATGCPYLAMEWIRGCSLRTLLHKEGPLATARAISMAAQVARALDYAHRRDVVHRDIKPANLLVVGGADHSEGGQTPGGGQAGSHPEGGQVESHPEGGQVESHPGGGQRETIKVVDFGIAKLVSKSLTQPGRVLGSPFYMAPEQVRGLEIDGRSDLFSLGAVLYECLTGRVAFAGETVANVSHKILSVDPRPIELYNPDVPASLRAVVQRSLEKLPHDRYRSGAELAVALETVGVELALGRGPGTILPFSGARGTATVATVAPEASSSVAPEPETRWTAVPKARSSVTSEARLSGMIAVSKQAKADLPSGTEFRGQVPGAELDRWRWPRALLLAALVLIVVVLVGPRILQVAEGDNREIEAPLAISEDQPPEAAAALAADPRTGADPGSDVPPNAAPAATGQDNTEEAVASVGDSSTGESSVSVPAGEPAVRPPLEERKGEDAASEVGPPAPDPPERQDGAMLNEPDPPAGDIPSVPLRGDDREGREVPARRPAPPATRSPSPAVATTDLEIIYHNHLKLAYFGVWIDDKKVLSEKLEASFFKRFKGREYRWTIPVAAGKRSVEVHVSGIEKRRLEAQKKVWRVFSAADPRRLKVELRSGSRRLDLIWEKR